MFIPLKDDNPTRITPFVTIAVIGACVVAFLFQLSLEGPLQERFVYAFGMIPAVLFGTRELDPRIGAVPASASLFTSMFLHGGVLHLAGNMLYLWIFGNNIEDVMGHVRFVVFYLACGLAAALTQAFVDPSSTIPMIGASGAIAGVLGAYIMLHPHAHVLVFIWFIIFIRTVWLPAGLVLGIWIALQVVNALLTPASQGGVAWFAHIGGFVAGMILIHLFRRDDPHDDGVRRGPWG